MREGKNWKNTKVVVAAVGVGVGKEVGTLEHPQMLEALNVGNRAGRATEGRKEECSKAREEERGSGRISEESVSTQAQMDQHVPHKTRREKNGRDEENALHWLLEEVARKSAPLALLVILAALPIALYPLKARNVPPPLGGYLRRTCDRHREFSC